MKTKNLYTVYGAAAVAALLTFAACSSEEDSAYYPQEPGSLSLSVQPTALTFSAGASTQEVNVSSNSRWSVEKQGGESGASWITLAYTSEPQGTADGTFSVTVAENKTGSNRSANVVVTGPEGQEVIAVTQGVGNLQVGATSLNSKFPVEGAVATITITTSNDWSITYAKEDWFEITPDKGNAGDNMEVKITVHANETSSERKANITVESADNGIASVPLTITQEAKPEAEVYLDKYTGNLKTIPYAGGETQISVRSSAAWSISTPVDWLTITPKSGSAGTDWTVVRLTAAPNTEERERTAEVEIRSDNALKETVTVTQAPYEAPVYNLATVGTPLVTLADSKTEATVGVSFSSETAVTSKGVRYRMSTSQDWLTIESTDTDPNYYSVTLRNLSHGMVYQVKGFVTNAAGTRESDVVEFKTSGRVPESGDNTPPSN